MPSTRVEVFVARAVILVIGGLALLTGCFPGGGAFQECRGDQDCAADEQCTRTRECLSGQLAEVRINWTVNGQAVSIANPGACNDGNIDHLAVTFKGPGEGDLTYTPVPCNLGQIYYDRMPPRFDRVTLEVFSPTERVLDAPSADIGPGENTVDLDIQAP